MADTDTYRANRGCACPRCRCSGYMGPAVLITLGVLFLIDQVSRFGFSETWPILLIVIGVVKVLQWSSPLTGHASQDGMPVATTTALAPPQPPSGTDPQVPHV